MQKELRAAVPLEDAAHSAARNFGSVFHGQVLWLESLDALLNERVGVPARPPQELRRLRNEDETHCA
jgi:hypothetical protein